MRDIISKQLPKEFPKDKRIVLVGPRSTPKEIRTLVGSLNSQNGFPWVIAQFDNQLPAFGEKDQVGIVLTLNGSDLGILTNLRLEAKSLSVTCVNDLLTFDEAQEVLKRFAELRKSKQPTASPGEPKKRTEPIKPPLADKAQVEMEAALTALAGFGTAFADLQKSFNLAQDAILVLNTAVADRDSLRQLLGERDLVIQDLRSQITGYQARESEAAQIQLKNKELMQENEELQEIAGSLKGLVERLDNKKKK